MNLLLSIARHQANHDQQIHSEEPSNSSSSIAVLDQFCSDCYPLDPNQVLSAEWNNFWTWITEAFYAQDFSARTVKAFETYNNTSREYTTLRDRKREKLIIWIRFEQIPDLFEVTEAIIREEIVSLNFTRSYTIEESFETRSDPIGSERSDSISVGSYIPVEIIKEEVPYFLFEEEE